MFYNGTACDVYIGTGAGKMLENDIRNAKSSVKIVSPYLSYSQIDDLKKLWDKNVEVKLITMYSEKKMPEHFKYLRSLIKQHRQENKAAIKQRKKWEYINQMLMYSSVGLLFLILILGVLFKSPEIGFAAAPLIITIPTYLVLFWKINNQKIYYYKYKPIVPLKIFTGPVRSKKARTNSKVRFYNKDNPFIHSKIYMIDENKVYLGSLNYTRSGTKYNLESRIKITDKGAIHEISGLFNDLFNNTRSSRVDIKAWGTRLYEEPIN